MVKFEGQLHLIIEYYSSATVKSVCEQFADESCKIDGLNLN